MDKALEQLLADDWAGVSAQELLAMPDTWRFHKGEWLSLPLIEVNLALFAGE